MTLNHNPFASKLNELDAEYTQMISKLKLCFKGTHEEITQAKNDLWEACQEQEAQLEETITCGRSNAVTELATLQLHYFKEIRKDLEERIPRHLDAESRTTDTSRAEAMALFAEFAIDNAIQGMRYALHASLSAVELQIKAEEPASR